MKIEKLPSGSYRVRKQINGQKITKVFDHKPSQKEITQSLAESIDDIAPRTSFYNCAQGYIKTRSNILSPSTIRGYNSFIETVIPDEFGKKKISDIDQIDIQVLINDYAVEHTPKSVRNLHGFISAVFKLYRPGMVLHTALPQKKPYEPYVPTSDEVKKVVEASEGTRYHIPFQLGVLGMRRGEICALTLEDIDGNIVKIDKTLVNDKENDWILKPCAKTEEGNREIFIPDKLRDEIKDAGVIYEGAPKVLLVSLHRYQDKLGIPRFRFHDLRHFYASYAHSMGMSDADIMKSGGWKSDYVMKNVYRHSMRDSLEQNQSRIANSLL